MAAASSSPAPKPVYFSDLDFTKIQVSAGTQMKAPGKDATVGFAHNITYDGQPLLIQFPPVITTVGIRPSKFKGGKYNVGLSFVSVDFMGKESYGTRPEHTSKDDMWYGAGKFYNKMREMAGYFHELTATNSKEWLGTEITAARAAALWAPIVKPDTNTISGEVVGKYAPIMSLDVGMIDGSFDITVKDSRDGKKGEPVDTGLSAIQKAFKAPSRFKGVVLFNGFYRNGSKFTWGFSLVYADLLKNLAGSAVRPPKALILDGELEEHEEDEARAFEEEEETPLKEGKAGGFTATSLPSAGSKRARNA